MKRLFFLLILLSLPLSAIEFDEVDFYEEAFSFRPFAANVTYINIQNAPSILSDVATDHLHYIQSDAAFAYTYTCSPYNGFVFGVGWVGTEVNMQNNPYFDETWFNYISFSIGGFSKSICDWLWTATFSLLMDTQEVSLSDYALYQGTIWGKYQASPCWEIDVGIITEVGLNKEKIWPLVGFIYNYSPTTRLHMIYPVDITLERDFWKFFTMAASVRFLRNRHRVLADNPLPRAIFEYRSTGVEFDLTFAPFDLFAIKGFVGSTTNANLKVTDENNHDPTYFKFKGSFYAGVTGQLSF